LRLRARWLGEFLREAAVLVLVFVPLDWFLGEHSHRLFVFAGALLAAVLLLASGMIVGFQGEMRDEGSQEHE
jgi:hypothetical protein